MKMDHRQTAFMLLRSSASLMLVAVQCPAFNSQAFAQESSLFHNPVVIQQQVRYMSMQTGQQASSLGNAPQGSAPLNSGGSVANPQMQPNNPLRQGFTDVLPPLNSATPDRTAADSQATNNSLNSQQVMVPPQSYPNSGQFPMPLGNGPPRTGTTMGYSPMATPTIQSPIAYTYQPPPRQRVLKVHDVIQIRVDELSRMTADGIAAQRKNTLYDARLLEWLRLDGTPVIPEDPKAVRGITNQNYRANSQLITRESLTFNIAAEIVDIYPNGNIVLEAHKTINNNDNRWQISLSGICQESAIGADNVVMSKDIINLKIDKSELGQARDGYRRGWFAEFMGRFQPF